MPAVELEYIAAGGNRHSCAADWTPDLLAFGSGNNIALWNPEDNRQNGISALLAGHSGIVSVVKIYDHGVQRFLLSGSVDKTIRIWKRIENSLTGFEEIQCLSGHQSSINTISTFPALHLFVTGAADGTVKVWRFEDSIAKLVQSIALKPRFLPLATAIALLSGENIALAVAGTYNNIQLYVRKGTSENFELQASLSGHEGWIRSLDFVREHESEESDIILASASQDKYVRLWRIRPDGNAKVNTQDDLSVPSLSNKAHQLRASKSKYSVTFEALLIGHEDWIYTVQWAPTRPLGLPPLLLSASADNSLAIWHADSKSGLWVCKTRLGEISSQKGSTTATGSTGGFWIGLWQPNGRSVVSLGRTGSWRQWCLNLDRETWNQHPAISGHVSEVQAIAWAPDGSYLLSTGSDQTTRLLAEWRRDVLCSWHELARPQIHGYDLNCIDTVTENRFISGADEKLLRVFNKPKIVGQLLSQLSGVTGSDINSLPEVANIPVLGLSNQTAPTADHEPTPNGVHKTDIDAKDPIDEVNGINKPAFDLGAPPGEDHLSRYTLWPEHEKLYGHGFEISAVATSHDGSLVATACKASSIEYAVIRLYETRTWREIKPPLTAHALTVTSLAFSPDDHFLLSVGRDRQWVIFERKIGTLDVYNLRISNPKSHSRMILGCAWAPAAVGHVFATAGRDKSVKIWRLFEETCDCITTINANTAVTAVAFSPKAQGEEIYLAYGTEEGVITLVLLDKLGLSVVDRIDIDRRISPSATVNSLRWRPDSNSLGPDMKGQLASANDDHSVRIYNIT